jgi:hypothetical protein
VPVRKSYTRVFVFVQDYTDFDDLPDFCFYDFGRFKKIWGDNSVIRFHLPKSLKSKK